MTQSGPAFIHPLALCESDNIGPGTRIWPFAQIMAGATIGAGCNVCGQAFIEGGAVVGDGVTIKNGALIWDKVTLEDEVFIGPGVVFTNDLRPRAAIKRPREEFLATRVRRGATVGANATVVCGVTIGEYGFVAAGSVVRDDVPAHALVVGNPARPAGWVCVCGQRLGPALTCDCGRAYDLKDESRTLVLRSTDEKQPAT